jgi:rsbT co-antagonist protein RsbR
MDARKRSHDHVGDILAVLAEVTDGKYPSIDTELPETHPMGALVRGINEAVASLAASRERAGEYLRELEDKLAVIERQQEAIRELSTPVIEVWDSVLCLPIVGILDTSRSVDLTQAVLHGVVEKRARCVIVDVTGIGIMDTRTVDQLIRMAKAVALLDARCYVTGISPLIAQTLDQMGVDLSTVATRRTLRDALQEYVLQRRRARQAAAGSPLHEAAPGEAVTDSDD